MSVSKRVRFEVFKRDKFTCQYCGKRPPEVMLEVDHVVPRCDGGSDDMANLVTACVPCNRGKAGIPLESVAPAIDEMEMLAGIQEMLERQMGLRQSMAVAEAKRKAMDDAVRKVWDWWEDAFGKGTHFEPAGVRKFLAELDMEDLEEAVAAAEAASERRRFSGYGIWKYFCGICWNMIKESRGDDA